ncbi:MAG: hypothetical protein B7Z55_10000, partial [Planctomycetales bacterium 12-60-4]
MPPDHPLSHAERLLLRDWILAGAPWASGPIDPLRYTSDARAGYDWWSLQPLRRSDIPPSVLPGVNNPIDRFVRDQLSQVNLAPSSEADRRTLIRRLSFDLLGLPPTPDDVEQFLDDPAPDAYEQLVERLLASPHYGER